jgi:hypothetical protein
MGHGQIMAALRPDREDYTLMKKIGNRGFVKGFLALFFLVAIVFVGVSFGKPYYRYYSLSSHTRDFLKSDTYNVETIRTNIMTDAEELKVPLAEEDLEVVVDKKNVKVKATWSETVDFWGYYQKTFDFVMEEDY